jgi:manganese/iron transport system ATP-binding protein/manganese/zinc/iron transport system ATP- binding protein
VSHHLAISDLTVSFNRIPAIHHLTLTLPCTSCVGLLGPNGAGKTTLLKAIAGLLPIETGGIAFKGHSVVGAHRPGKSIAYVPQREAVDWDFPITVQGLVEMGRYPALGLWKPFATADREIVDRALELMDLSDYASRQISALSGGQQQRAFLARAWAQQSDIYLLDEPTTGLDQNARTALMQVLHRLRDDGKLIIASHHQLSDVPELFDEVVILNGELVAAGATDSAFTKENIDRAFETRVFSGSHEH